MILILALLGLGGVVIGAVLMAKKPVSPAHPTNTAPEISSSASPNFEPAVVSTSPEATAILAAPDIATPTMMAAATPNSKTNADGVDLILVPAGEFTMGRNPDPDPNVFWGAEAPPHTVSLNSYYIYKTEVTNGMYQACVAAQACPKPEGEGSRTRKDYYGNPTYDNYPVIFVSWLDAESYCKWAGGHLPTEAEWEKAARGTDGRYFPWGNGPLQGNLANFCDQSCPESEKENGLSDGYADTAPVGSYPDGASPYGALDMAGNVWEWVSDFFNPGYYQVSPAENPQGPSSGSRRVIRGGSWANPASGIRTVARASQKPNDTLDTLGFRCAASAP